MKQKILFTKKINSELRSDAEKQNIEVREEQMISINLVDAEKVAPVLRNVLNCILVFTSRNAVKALAQSPGFEKAGSLRVYAVGHVTAEAVRSYLKIDAASGGSKNAGGLAQYIIDHELPTKVYFFCGNKRRDELPQLLTHAGFEVEEVIVYETKLTPKKVDDHFNGVVFFSPSAVESFFKLNNLTDGVVCYSIGDTTTEELRKFTKAQIFTAKEPTERCLLQLIIAKSGSKQ